MGEPTRDPFYTVQRDVDDTVSYHRANFIK